jgi:hypothetical protein
VVPLSPLAVIDEGLALLRGRAALTALMVVAVLPGRLLLVELVWAVVSLPSGSTAAAHADALGSRALWWLPCWLAGLVLRQMSATALRRRAAPAWPGTEEVASHLATATLLGVVVWATLPTVLLPLPALLVLNFAAVAQRADRFRLLGQASVIVPLLAIGAMFLAVLAVLTVNLWFLGQALVWLAGPVLDTAALAQAGMAASGPLSWLLAAACASAIMEPAWTAALTALALRGCARRTGEDLRAALERLA